MTFFLAKVMIERDVELNGQLIANYLNQRLRPDFFGAPQRPDHPEFGAIFGQLKDLTQVEHIKVFAPDGRIVWSDEPDIVDTVEVPEKMFLGALGGELQAHFEWTGHATGYTSGTNPPASWPWFYEIYIPVHAGADKVVGIVEIYRAPRFIVAELTAGLMTLWTILAMAGGAYYLISTRMFSQASDELVALHSTLERSRRLAAVGKCVSMIVHDTRNLLASIRFASTRLESDHISGEQRKELVRALKQPLEMSFDMMNDLLDYVSGKKPTIVCTRHNLRGLLDKSQPLISSLLEPSGHTLGLRMAEDICVCCDPQKLLHIIINLVRNSTEALAGPGDITIEASRVGDRTRIAVRDTGKGIPEDLLPYVFEPFVSEQGKSRPGLGLAIVRHLTESMGGRIMAGNHAGGGAEFVFSLPDCKSPASAN